MQLDALASMLQERYPERKRKTFPLWAAILDEFDRQRPPMTVRQMFYRISTISVVPKTEAGYRRVQRAVVQMRRAGALPYGYIADNTRWVRKPTTYEGIQDALQDWQDQYRRALWTEQGEYVEVWIEKDALAGMFSPITSRYDVPLYVARGYPSESYLYDAAEGLKAIAAHSKHVTIYHFGDLDPSGRDAARHTAAQLRHFGAEFEFVEAALTPEQVQAYALPTRPTKKTDSRAKKWKGDSVELDALPPAVLRSLVMDCIERHIDARQLTVTQSIEAEERARIIDLFGQFGTSTKTA